VLAMRDSRPGGPPRPPATEAAVDLLITLRHLEQAIGRLARSGRCAAGRGLIEQGAWSVIEAVKAETSLTRPRE